MSRIYLFPDDSQVSHRYKKQYLFETTHPTKYSVFDMSGTGEKDIEAVPAHVEHPIDEGMTTTKRTVNNQMDEAARILAEAGQRDYPLADRKRVLRRIDLYVCLPMCLVYFLQQLDKSSVS